MDMIYGRITMIMIDETIRLFYCSHRAK